MTQVSVRRPPDTSGKKKEAKRKLPAIEDRWSATEQKMASTNQPAILSWSIFHSSKNIYSRVCLYSTRNKKD
jgi:hypothetical protein